MRRCSCRRWRLRSWSRLVAGDGDAEVAAKIPVERVDRVRRAPASAVIRDEEEIAGQAVVAQAFPEHEERVTVGVVGERGGDVPAAAEGCRDGDRLRVVAV